MQLCNLQRLDAFADGELHGPLRSECEQHLAECALCRAELAEILALRDFLIVNAPAVPPSISLAGRVRERIAQPWWARAAAAAILLVALSSGFEAGRKLAERASGAATDLLPTEMGDIHVR